MTATNEINLGQPDLLFMIIKMLCVRTAVMFVLIFCGCKTKSLDSSQNVQQLSEPNHPPRSEEEIFVRNNSDFAVSLYKLLHSKSSNLVFSPFSITTALAWQSLGTQGETLNEIREALRFTQKEELLHSVLKSIKNNILEEAKNSNVDFNVANSLWLQLELSVKKSFITAGRDFYDADLIFTDFAKNPTETYKQINSWIDDKTKGKIPNFLSPQDINPQMVFVLVNAIYFNGKWEKPFKTNKTKSTPFCVPDKGTLEVPTMISDLMHVQYAQTEDAYYVELPYKDKKLSLGIILPKQIGGLKKLEQKLSGTMLYELVSSTKTVQMEVFLPKFDINYKKNISNELQSLGIKRAFNPLLADFQRLAENIHIGTVLHNALINVDEHGTEAAAVTAVGGYGGGRPNQFIVNHPFIFIIKDNRTKTILFMGAMNNPLPTGLFNNDDCKNLLPLRIAETVQTRTSSVEISGALNELSVKRIVHRNINEVDFCYQHEYRQQENLKPGEVAVNFFVSVNGTVQSEVTIKSTLNSSKVEQCIKEAFLRWKFPTPGDGKPVKVTYIISFETRLIQE